MDELRDFVVTRTYYVTATDEYAAVRAAGGPTLKTTRVATLDKETKDMHRLIAEYDIDYLMEDPLRRERPQAAPPKEPRRHASPRRLRAAS